MVDAPLPAAPKRDARAEILAAAKDLFRQRGYSAVSINDIVEAVGYKKPTIYHYFQDKETLFTEVLVEMLRRGSQFIAGGAARGKTLREKLTRLAEGYFRFCPTSLNTMMRDASEHLNPLHMKRVVEAHRFYTAQPFELLFSEALASGEIRPAEPQQLTAEQLALVFISMIDSMTTFNTVYQGRDFDATAHARAMVGIFMDGIAA